MSCSSMMCRECGNRVPEHERFYCQLCFSSIVLLPSGGLKPPDDGGPDGPPGGPGGGRGGPSRERVFRSSPHFEHLMPELAEVSQEYRRFFHDGAIGVTLERTESYAFDEARREDIDNELDYKSFDDEEEAARRADALAGARWLARDLRAAEARGELRTDLLSDAFGVTRWAINVSLDREPPAERLAQIGDLRLRFAVGYAMPMAAPGSYS